MKRILYIVSLVSVLAIAAQFDGCTRVTPTLSAKARTATAQAQKSLTPVEITRIVTVTPSVTATVSSTPLPPTFTPQTPTMTAFPPLRDAGGTIVPTPTRIIQVTKGS